VTIYVENLLFGVTPDDLTALFAPYGRVTSARVWTDRDAGPTHRVGFVDLADGGRAAVAALDGSEYRGRVLLVGETDLRSETGLTPV
jgi:RNA recognition motif-containing protein